MLQNFIGGTGWLLSDRLAEHLRFVKNNDVDKPIARYFNDANHSISDIKVCVISPISDGNDSRKRHEKRLIFKIGTIHPHGLNQRFSFIWSFRSLFLSSMCGQKRWLPFHSIVYVRPPLPFSLHASASFTDRL